jgi:hypothetical protein
MSDSRQSDTWYSILDLSWLRAFLTCIASVSDLKSRISERVPSMYRALPPIVDRYVSTIEGYKRDSVSSADRIEDCMTSLEEWIDKLADADPACWECISPEIEEITNRIQTRSFTPSPLLRASQRLAKFTDEEIAELAGKTADNASVIRTLAASLIR